MSFTSVDELPVAHVCRTLRNEFETMRRALTCSICMSTYVDPVTLSSCVHAFCRSCISHALRSTQQKCPLCLKPCSRRSLTAAPELSVAVRCYKNATRAFGLAPATYTDSIAMTQLPADEPPQVDMVTAHDELLAARTFSKFNSESDYIQQEQRDVVAVNERFLLQSAVQQEPSISQIRQEAQNQYAADNMHSDPSDDEDDQEEKAMPSQSILDAMNEPSPSASPFAADCSPVPRSRVREIVEALERRTSLQQSPLFASPSCGDSVSGRMPRNVLRSPQVSDTGVDPPIGEQRPSVTSATLAKERQTSGASEGDRLDFSLVPGASLQENHSSTLPTSPVTQTKSATASSDIHKSPAFVEPTPKPIIPSSSHQLLGTNEEEDRKMPFIDHVAHQSEDPLEEEDSKPAFVEPTPVARLPSRSEGRNVETSVEISVGTETSEKEALSRAERFSGPSLAVDTNIASSVGAENLVTPASAPPIDVGTIVDVQARTWPGINQPGGVATILAVHHSLGTTSYDVQYVLDRRKERGVESKYVKLDEAIDSASKGRDSGSRNRRKCNGFDVEEIPPELLSELKSEGFDVTGEQTTRILSARTNTDSSNRRLKRKSKEKKSSEKKRQKSPRYDTANASNAMEVGPLERPRWTASTKCKKADEHYFQYISKAMEKGVVYVCTSGLSEAEETMLKELSRKVKSTKVRLFITDSIQQGKTTICVVPSTLTPRSVSHNTVAARRTMKTMHASLYGIPLVSSNWISECLQRKNVMTPEATMFIRSLPTKRADTKAHYGVALLAALGDQPQIFPGISVCLCGFSQKNEIIFRGLLQEAGVHDVIVSKQTAVSRVRAVQAPNAVVLLCDNGNASISTTLEEAIRRNQDNVAIVDSPWLVDSVSCGFAMEPSEYPPKKGKGKAKSLWDLTKSKSFVR